MLFLFLYLFAPLLLLLLQYSQILINVPGCADKGHSLICSYIAQSTSWC
jgi:hypothetical protein